MRAALIFTLLVTSGTQSPLIQNGQVQSQPVTSLTRDVAAVAASATTPTWVAWQVPMTDGTRNLCCYYSDDTMTNGVRGCRVEPADPDSPRAIPQFPSPTGPVKLEAGTEVITLLGAANRDPRVYDDPERFDVGRDGLPPMSFGSGIHYCLGASLARAEGQAQYLAKPGIRILGVVVGIAGAAAIAHTHVQLAVRAEVDPSAIVIAVGRMRDVQQHIGRSAE